MYSFLSLQSRLQLVWRSQAHIGSYQNYIHNSCLKSLFRQPFSNLLVMLIGSGCKWFPLPHVLEQGHTHSAHQVTVIGRTEKESLCNSIWFKSGNHYTHISAACHCIDTCTRQLGVKHVWALTFVVVVRQQLGLGERYGGWEWVSAQREVDDKKRTCLCTGTNWHHKRAHK